jgi:hypothetical protein
LRDHLLNVNSTRASRTKKNLNADGTDNADCHGFLSALIRVIRVLRAQSFSIQKIFVFCTDFAHNPEPNFTTKSTKKSLCPLCSRGAKIFAYFAHIQLRH